LCTEALQEGARLQTALNQQLNTLDRAQKNYEKAFREAERAEDAYRKADADLNLSRAEVEKQRINSSIKNHQCEDNKNEYAKQLQKTNELQGQHYQVLFQDILSMNPPGIEISLKITNHISDNLNKF
jgi:formin-binding protein 1